MIYLIIALIIATLIIFIIIIYFFVIYYKKFKSKETEIKIIDNVDNVKPLYEKNGNKNENNNNDAAQLSNNIETKNGNINNEKELKVFIKTKE